MSQDDHSRSDESALAATTVLLVADDMVTCAIFGKLLMKPLGCAGRGATSTEAALRLLTTERISLVLLVTGGGARGTDRLRALLRAEEPVSVPVMVVVHNGDAMAHVDFLQQGAADAVAFPCPGPEIVARARRLLMQALERQGRVAQRRYSLAGDLSGLSLTDLIAVLEYTSGSGVLHLLTPRGTGRLFFKSGRVSNAEFENLEGRAAFFELLREREAQFEFVSGDWVAGEPRGALEGSNIALLLEGARSLDERDSPSSEPDPVRRDEKPSWHDSPGVAPPLAPDPELAETCVAAARDPGALGELRLLNRIQIRSSTGAPARGQALRLDLLTDLACGVQVLSRLASPLGEDEIVRALKRPPQTVGFTWAFPGDRTLEILLLDQERLSSVVDSVLGCPAVLIVAPSYGDFLTLDVPTRSALQSLLERTPPLLILGVGNGALQEHLRDFLRFIHVEVPQHFIRGSLWKFDPNPRALVQEAVRLWAALPPLGRAEAA